MSDTNPTSYEAFWAFYVRAHQNPINRRLHTVGTSVGALVGLHGLLTGRPRRLLTGFAIGYAAAWTGHFVFEGNKPASFGHPLWSFVSDWKMLYLTLTGAMDAEVAKHTAPAEPPADSAAPAEAPSAPTDHAVN